MQNDLSSAVATPLSPTNATATSELEDIVHGGTPLLAAANPLLNLIPQLRATPTHTDPEALRNYLVSQVQAFAQRAKQVGIRSETILGAQYCLCTALDETVGQTPWGGSGEWAKNSLLVTFHNEAWGGEKFFQLLSKLAQNPQQHIDLLELMNACLAMGFEGRYRIVDNGRSQLETLRQRLVDIIRTARGQVEPPLALHWRGAANTGRRGLALIPVWIVALLALLIGVGLFYWFAFRLSTQSDRVHDAIYGLPKFAPLATAKPAPPASPRLRKFLEPEQAQGLVDVLDTDTSSTVIIRGDGLFDSASPVVRDNYLPLFVRIASALSEIDGPVTVRGYTDNTPIQTRRFRSNVDLSQARADAVKELLERNMSKAGRIKAEGMGATDAIAPNDTPANRARNRRVEITLELAPEMLSNQLNPTK